MVRRLHIPPPPPSTAPPAAAPRPAPPRRVAVPREPTDWVHTWGGLLLALLVCLPPLLVHLGRAEAVSGAEASALLVSRDTWQRTRGGRRLAWLSPSVRGREGVASPPMTAWLHGLAWWDLDLAPAETAPGTLVLRARLVSVAMALLAVAATFWAGMMLGGGRTARLAAMVLGTTLLLIHQARLASPDAVLLGYSTLAVAAGLWAIRPLRPASRAARRVIGWLIAGVAMGAAILTRGPIGLLFILPPLIAAILLTPRRRVDSTIGLLFALTLGATLTSPWYLYVLEETPDAWRSLLGWGGFPSDLFLLTWSHGRVLVMLSCWQVFLIGALCQPFLRANRPARRQLLIAWFWFVPLTAALSIPAARDPRYLTPILPAAALMIGQLWSYHARLASARQEEPGVDLLRTPHWLLIGLVSILGPLLIALQPELVRAGWLDRPLLPGLGWSAALALGGTLFAIALAGAGWHFKWRPRLAAYATLAWMIVAATAGFHAYAGSYHSRNPHRRDAARVAAASAGQPLARLRRKGTEDPPAAGFLFYLGRPVRPVNLKQLRELAEQAPGMRVIADRRPADASPMLENDFQPGLRFSDGSGSPRRLYRPRPKEKAAGG